MIHCGGCGKFLSTIGAAKCSGCVKLFHKACVGISDNAQPSERWNCPECISKRPKVGNVDTPVKWSGSSSERTDTSKTTTSETCHKNLDKTDFDSTHTLELGVEIRLFREELQHLRKELKEFRANLCDIRGAITECNQRMDDFNGRLINLEQEVKVSSSHKCTNTTKLEETIFELKAEIENRDQELLQGDIEITNLPEINGENPYHTVTCIATKLGITLDERDIISAERVGKKTESEEPRRGRRMVVRLSRPILRDDFLRNARTRRNVTTEGLGLDLPTRRFYVNERLTKRNKNLFHLVRETAKQSQWRYTWTKKGKIYTRQGEGKPAYQIKSEIDIKRVFGNITVGMKETF